MILEAAAIIAAGVGLIAFQPPLYRLFPPKPKATVWEEFWTQEAIDARWKTERPSGWGAVYDGLVQQKSDLAKYEAVLKDQYVAQAKRLIDDSAQLFQEIKAETHNGPATSGLMIKPIGTLTIQTADGEKVVAPARLDAALSKTTNSIQRGMQVYLDHAVSRAGDTVVA
jgi:hypothetical protein